jgi:hypothetical protein
MLKVSDENSRIRIQGPDPNPNPDPLVRSMDPRIRIHPKMSWIRNTGSWICDCKRVYFLLLEASDKDENGEDINVFNSQSGPL